MSRSTKLAVILSNLAALWLSAMLVSRGLPSILAPAVGVFIVSSAAAFLAGDLVMSVLLSVIYLFPALCFAWFHTFIFSYYGIWMAGVAGAMLPRALWSPWAFPGRLRAPLVLWALVLACSWPIVVLRELDFVPALLSPDRMAASRLPQSPAIIIVWIASVASIALTGLLLLDWLFLAYFNAGSAERLPATPGRFERRVIWPLFCGALVAAAVAAYQSLVDISFLNQTFFQGIGRAVGTMRDANAFGAVASLWLPVAAAMALATPGRRVVAAACGIAFLLLGIAVWGSGSRTALLGAVIGMCVMVVCSWRLLSRTHRAAGAIGAVVIAAVIVGVVPSTTVQRARAMVPSLSAANVRSAAYQLWSRDMYGTAAVRMISEHPFVGIGVGGFNYQYTEVLYRINRTERPPDNAQNWYRHQLAELGLLGSAGWILWLGMFAWMLFRCRDAQDSGVIAAAPKGAIAGLAVASLLGVPTQDAAPSISFVVFACWAVMLKAPRGCAVLQPASQHGAREWWCVLLVMAAFLGGTIQAARTELRPPLRALRINFPYEYGFVPDKTDPTTRWTRAKAVEVFAAEKRWLKVEVGAAAPDAAVRPVDVRIRLNGKPILQVARRSDFPITRWIRMPPYGTYLLLQIDVSRTWRPADFGGAAEDGERGIAVRALTFSDADPPKGSVTFESPDEFTL